MRANAAFGRDEAWRPVRGYEGFYEVSTLGRVRDAATSRIKPQHDGGLRMQVRLTKFKETRTERVHRLVAWAFLGDRWNHLHKHVAHLDGDYRNNCVDNLKWVSQTENEHHKRMHGTVARGERNGRAKLTAQQVAELRDGYDSGVSAPTLARKYGICRQQAHRIATGGAW